MHEPSKLTLGTPAYLSKLPEQLWLPARLPRELRMRNANASSDVGEDRAGRVHQICLKLRRAMMLQAGPWGA